MTIFAPLIGLALLAFLVYANIWDGRRMATMTPRERETDDREARREDSIW